MSDYIDRIIAWCATIAILSAVFGGICLVASLAYRHNGLASADTADTLMMVGTYLLCYGYLPMVLICFTLMMSVLSSDRLPMRGTRQFILTKEIAMKKAFGFYDSSMPYSRHVKKVLDRRNQASQELQPKTFSRHPNSKKRKRRSPGYEYGAANADYGEERYGQHSSRSAS